MKIAVTMGDACGVGPELVLRAFHNGELNEAFIVIGDIVALHRAAQALKLDVAMQAIALGGELTAGALNVVDAGLLKSADITPGVLSRAAGDAAVQYVECATRAALGGAVDAIVTLPINKEASSLTHPGFQGHTELIAELCGVRNYTMMLVAPTLIVTHISTHVSMLKAVRRVRKKRILDVIRLTSAAVRTIRPRARIAVAGLNPHAGEHGLFGREDLEEIAPAIAAARAEGIDAYGPAAPDTVFVQAVEHNACDAVVCMYHDQGHIPLKLLGFHDGVNVTIGLPIIRTSVDHGTAFDIAYKGVASTRSFAAAFALAATMARAHKGTPRPRVTQRRTASQ